MTCQNILALGLPAALVAAAIGVAHICASCGSPDLSNKITFPTVSRVYPADSLGGQVMAELVSSFNYTQVAVIARNDAWGVGIMGQFIRSSQALGLEIVSAAQFDEDQSDPLETLSTIKTSGARIIISFVFDCNRFFAAAEELEMTAPRYLYFGGPGWPLTPWTDATREHMRGSLMMNQ